MNDFQKYALSQGISTNKLESYGNYNLKNFINPTILEERQLNVVGYDVFSRLMVDKIIYLGSAIDEDAANIIVSQLMYLNSIDDGSDIKLFINSPGGSVIDGLAIYDVMNWIKPDVATYCMGMAASMGSILVSSGEKGKRYILPHGQVMIHQPMSGTGPGTRESDFAIAYDQLKKCKSTLYGILSENTGKSIEEITEDADRDHWLSAEETLPGVYGPYGLIDEIIRKSK